MRIGPKATKSPSPGKSRGRREVWSISFALCFFFLALAGASQEPPRTETDAADCTYRIQSGLVLVPVSVSDPLGTPVRDLSVHDFVVEENGKVQTLSGMAEPGRSSLDLILLFDISGSMTHQFRFAQAAAAAFLRRVALPSDTLSLGTIGPEPHVDLLSSGDIEAVLEALGRLTPTRGATAFYDSIVSAATAAASKTRPGVRRVELVLSDGEDNNSTVNALADAARALQQADCIFYAINPSGRTALLNRISTRGQRAMENLAAQTGGTAFMPENFEELPAIFNRIAAELQSQYLLEYYPADAESSRDFRSIVVRIPSRPDLRIRARQGYFAPRS